MKCENCGAEMGEATVCKFCGHTAPQKEAVQNVTINYYGTAPGAEVVPPLVPPVVAPVVQPVYQTVAQQVSDKSKVVAIVIWLIFGLFGGHQFYAGKMKMGLIYFFTAGLFSIGWLVDGISLFAGTFKDQHGYPIKN